MSEEDRIHRILDGEATGRPEPATPEGARLARYESTLALLGTCEEPAPPSLAGRVMGALPGEPDVSWADRLRRHWEGWLRWAAPALAGALATLLVVLAIGPLAQRSETMSVAFEVHAPHAERVELVGSFTGWTPGEIVLQGPDASGHWTATVELPEGRHEYLFLVDGERWMTDPRATAYRPDGFGRQNALIEL